MSGVSCNQAAIGTGFLLAPTLIATVDHVIAGATVISLIAGEQRTTGIVIGSDPATDIALVRANRPLDGYHFHLATSQPAIGSRVAAIGFPIGDPITLTVGDISGLNRNLAVEDKHLTGLIETVTAITAARVAALSSPPTAPSPASSMPRTATPAASATPSPPPKPPAVTSSGRPARFRPPRRPAPTRSAPRRVRTRTFLRRVPAV